MGHHVKTQVRLVISHLEGSSGNFLARLLTDRDLGDQTLWRVDTQQHPDVLSTDGRLSFADELGWIDQHTIVVTHQFDLDVIRRYCPQAHVIQIWPEPHWGNVLYNACMKKSRISIKNELDQHVINLRYWWDLWQTQVPPQNYMSFHDLRCQNSVEQLAGRSLTPTQTQFFHSYWQQQLSRDLVWPQNCDSISQLIDLWNIRDWFVPWSQALCIFVFETVNSLQDHHRLWSIDFLRLETWHDLEQLAHQYRRS